MDARRFALLLHPSLLHSPAGTDIFCESRLKQPVLSSLSREDPSPTNYQGFQENSRSSSAVAPLPSPPSFPFFFLFPPAILQPSLSLSLSLSPHPSPPLLRVSGKLFFLCLLLMKGCTKLPSLCPCVVGKNSSLFPSSFFLHLSVAASVLHVAQSLPVAPAALWEDRSFICVYCLQPDCYVLCGVSRGVPHFIRLL